jgi:hypothetical protein
VETVGNWYWIVDEPTPVIQLVLTLRGVGLTPAAGIALEVGDVTRVCDGREAGRLCGTTPRVHVSGGKTRFGPSRPGRSDLLDVIVGDVPSAVESTPMRYVLASCSAQAVNPVKVPTRKITVSGVPLPLIATVARLAGLWWIDREIDTGICCPEAVEARPLL